ncbi:MAG TPA: OmpW family outer membrane protein, partial [Thermoanaerobaculia bacterium]|nr:OmpW family outer membrane protein [Thermoanaerobaculia bacterium]
MHRKLLILLILLGAATPAFAQRSLDVNLWASWIDASGDARVEELETVDQVEFDSDMGYGLGVNFFWSRRISIEAAVFRFAPEAAATASDPALGDFTLGELEMIPITLTLQLHLFPEARFDPYVGAGLAYVLFDELDSEDDLSEIGVERIDIEDDYGIVFNAGFNIVLNSFIAI